MTLDVEAFPEDGISYSENAIDTLRTSPWLEDAVQQALVGFMVDLMDLKKGVPLAGMVAESLEALKQFADGAPFIGIKGFYFDMMVSRRGGGYGWSVEMIYPKTRGLN